MYLEDLIARLLALFVSGGTSLEAWRILAGHPWTLGALRVQACHIVRVWGLPPWVVEDLVQDAIVELARRRFWERLDFNRPAYEICAYLLTQLRWALLDVTHRLLRSRRALGLDSAPEPSISPDHCLDVHELVDALPARQRAIVKMRLDGQNYATIAASMGCSISSAHKQFRLAQGTLAAALAS